MLANITPKKYNLSIYVFIFVTLLLSIVQIKLNNPIILAERFYTGAGWIEILFVAIYGSLIAYKMQNPINVPKWRNISWTIFSIVFFGQLIIGLTGFDIFLMTGKLHLPIPAMILAGPIYREQLSVMSILFLSTILLTGPAWCSQFCYMGAVDSLASKNKTSIGVLKNKNAIKATILTIVVGVTLLLKWLNVPTLYATLTAIAFGIIGFIVMLVLSRKKGKMVHCIVYCPIGTIVNILKPVSPFRMKLNNNCTLCMKCTTFCKYDALNVADIKNKKPSKGCTYCGDCLAGCNHNAIEYNFFKLKPYTARNLYLFITISLHAVCLALARI